VCTWFLSPQPFPGRVSAGDGAGGGATGGVTTGGVTVVVGGVVSGGDSSGCDVGADGVVSTGGLVGVTFGGAGVGVTGVDGVDGAAGDVGVVVGGAGVFVAGGKAGFAAGGAGTDGVLFAGPTCAANCGSATGASRTGCCFATIVRGRVTTRACTCGGAVRTGAATEPASGGGAGSTTTTVGRCRTPRIRVSAITPTAQAARNARSIYVEVSSRRQTAQVRP
jgi:fibronectin-binding autotransporter adhesin